jgi:hypothetical protein
VRDIDRQAADKESAVRVTGNRETAPSYATVKTTK